MSAEICVACGRPTVAHQDNSGRARDCTFAAKKARKLARKQLPPPAIGEIPARCDADWMMRIFQLQESQFYKLKAAGYFDRLELRPEIGPTRWSGELVKAYLRGELHWHIHAPRKRKRGPKTHALQKVG